jgi:hypothetical protein
VIFRICECFKMLAMGVYPCFARYGIVEYNRNVAVGIDSLQPF